jgi:PAS domain S-box-containing protein
MSPTPPVASSNFAPSNLDAALDLLRIGVGVFDAAGHLLYSNSSFRGLRFLPHELCTPYTPLREIIHYIAARGDYGPGSLEALVRERLADATSGKYWEAEQDIPGGRRLQISHTPTPQGGVMITYADVTEARATERKLRENEERYGLVSRAVAEGIYDWNVAANTLYVSERVMEILGLEGSLTSQDWYRRVHPEDAERYRGALRACFRRVTEKIVCEYRILGRDGAYRWVADHGLPIRDDAGRAIRLVGCVSDISQRRLMEQALLDSEQRYASAMRAINESVYQWNVATGEMYYSPRLYEALGLTREELCTREDWIDRIHPDDLAQFRAANVAHLKGHTERLETEYRYQHPDGTWHWARQHGVVSRDSTGRALLMVGSTGDITAEKKLAEELEGVRRQLHDALEAIGEGFVLFDADDRIVMCNSRYRSWFLEVADQVVPGNKFESFMRAAVYAGLFPAAEMDREGFIAAIQERRNNPSGPREQYLRSGIWLQISDYRMKDGSRVGVYTDITEQKQRQQEVAKAKVDVESALGRLQAAQQQLIIQGKMALLGQLTAGIAHEIKNPLNFVNNFSGLSRELLEELTEIVTPLLARAGTARHQADEVLATLDGNLAKISEHGARADRIVKNMLKHSRSDDVQRGLVGINAVVEESLNLAYHSARVEMPGFDVRIVRDLDLSAGEVDGFAQDLSRALLNLIGNGLYAAYKRRRRPFADAEPTFAVSTRGTDARVEVHLRDNGDGIVPELRERLFTPFFTTKPPGEGTGLGLSLAYDIIVKQHGGEIVVDSIPGDFAEFVVIVPRVAPSAAELWSASRR